MSMTMMPGPMTPGAHNEFLLSRSWPARPWHHTQAYGRRMLFWKTDYKEFLICHSVVYKRGRGLGRA